MIYATVVWLGDDDEGKELWVCMRLSVGLEHRNRDLRSIVILGKKQQCFVMDSIIISCLWRRIWRRQNLIYATVAWLGDVDEGKEVWVCMRLLVWAQ